MDRMKRAMQRVLGGTGILLILSSLGSAQTASVFTKMTVNADPTWDRVRIFLNTGNDPGNAPIKYLSNPARVQITLNGTLDGIDEGLQRFSDSYLKAIAVQKVPSRRQVVMTVQLSARAPGVKTRFYSNDRQEFFYIDILRPSWHQQPTWTEKTLSRAKSQGQPVVVIDPGHGGYDPGAISPHRRSLEEKDVCLDVSKEVARILMARGKIYPMLTRGGDYFLTLDERVDFLRDAGGDLFVSIHADSAPSRSAKGFGVWVIDRDRNDVNSDARRLLKFGWQQLFAAYAPRQQSLMMSRQERYVVQETDRIAKTMVASLDRIPRVENRGAKTHPKKLRVLRHNFAPAILIETGFLSNSSDASRLARQTHRRELAEAIADGIESYFLQKARAGVHSPLKPEARVHMADTTPESIGETFTYTVRRGDSLTGLARKFGVQKEQILIASGLPLTRRTLYQDELLKIPKAGSDTQVVVSEQPVLRSADTLQPDWKPLPGNLGVSPQTLSLEKPSLTTYKVRDTDNLLRIAHMHGTTMSEILKLNRWSDGRLPRPGETMLVPANGRPVPSENLGAKGLVITNLERAWAEGSPPEGSQQTVASPEPAPVADPPMVDYEVKPGDNLSEIASRYGTTVEDLRRQNNLKSDIIHVKQVLRVPFGRTSQVEHKVRRGESLESLSKLYGTSIDEIRNLNNIKSDQILAGDVLRIR